jgi:DNA-binding transcriptional MerR regulator
MPSWVSLAPGEHNVTSKQRAAGELARLCGVSPDTIRHYERIGILPPSLRTASGYRLYRHDAIDRVRLAKAALQLGFTLRELSEILRVRDRGGVPCQRLLELAQEKLLCLKKEIAALERTDRYIRRLVRSWKLKMLRAGPARRAMLLHDLADERQRPSMKTVGTFRERRNT